MLLLDIGNSAIKGQWWSNDKLGLSFTCRYQAGWQSRLIACLEQTTARRCYYSSVQNAQIESEITDLLGKNVQTSNLVRLGAKRTCCGITSAYREPESLGTDRWLGLIGASRLVQQDSIIIDLGSAITIDLLRADGQHLGGAILPGFHTSIEQFKQIMRSVDFTHAEISHTAEPGCFTEACINIDYEIIDAVTVERLVDRWITRLSPETILVLTGPFRC